MVSRAWVVALLALTALGVGAEEPTPAESLAYRVLLQAKSVRTAAAAPHLDAELVALRELFAQGREAVPALRTLAREASPAGRVLALCALEVLEDSACEDLRAALTTSPHRVLVAWSPKLAWNDLPLREVIASTREDAARKPPGSSPTAWGFVTGTPDVLGGGLPWGTVLQPPASEPRRLAGDSLETWIARLSRPNRLIRAEAQATLVALGPASVAPLASALAHPAQGRWAAETLGSLGFLAVDAIPALRDGLSGGSPLSRLACARTLGSLGPYAQRAGSALAARVADPEELLAVRLACLQTGAAASDEWARLLPSGLTSRLVALGLDHPDPAIARAAESQLSEPTLYDPGQPEAFFRLVAAADDPQPWQQALGSHPHRVTLMAQAVCHPVLWVREQARTLLSADPAIPAALRDELALPDPLRRGRAAVALQFLHPGEVSADPLCACLADPTVAVRLLPGLLEAVEPSPAVMAAVLDLACGESAAASLAARVYPSAPPRARIASDRLLELRLAEDPSPRALLLALRSTSRDLSQAAERILTTQLRAQDLPARRQAAALLLEGPATDATTLTFAWAAIADGLRDDDPRAWETLEAWARQADLSLAPRTLQAWLDSNELPLVGFAAGSWLHLPRREQRGTRQAAMAALLRLAAQPSSRAARVSARRAFAAERSPERVATTLEAEFGEDVGGVIYRGLIAALLGDPDGPWVARTLRELLLDLDLDDLQVAGLWSGVLTEALPRSSLPVRWHLLRTLERLGPAAQGAAPALRQLRRDARDPWLQLAVDEALRSVLGA